MLSSRPQAPWLPTISTPPSPSSNPAPPAEDRRRCGAGRPPRPRKDRTSPHGGGAGTERDEDPEDLRSDQRCGPAAGVRTSATARSAKADRSPALSGRAPPPRRLPPDLAAPARASPVEAPG